MQFQLTRQKRGFLATCDDWKLFYLIGIFFALVRHRFHFRELFVVMQQIRKRWQKLPTWCNKAHMRVDDTNELLYTAVVHWTINYILTGYETAYCRFTTVILQHELNQLNMNCRGCKERHISKGSRCNITAKAKSKPIINVACLHNPLTFAPFLFVMLCTHHCFSCHFLFWFACKKVRKKHANSIVNRFHKGYPPLYGAINGFLLSLWWIWEHNAMKVPYTLVRIRKRVN